MNVLNLGIAETFFNAVANGAQNSTAFALPSAATQITWQTSFGSAPASVTLQLQTSNDNSTWSIVDTSTNTAGESRTLVTSALFIRVREDAISGGSTTTVILIAKRLFAATVYGGGLSVKALTLFSADMLSLDSSAIGIIAVPAPGINKVIQLFGVSVLTQPGSIPYVDGSRMGFGIGAAVSSVEEFGKIDSSIFTSSTSKYATSTITNVAPSGSNAINQPLLIFLEGASFSAGNGTVKVLISYSINDFSQ